MKMIHGMNKQIDRYVSSFLSILLGFTLFLAGCTLDEQNNSEVADKPNILLILVDDMGYGDLKSYNPQSKIPTPNLDRLATEGMHFTDAHAPGAVCHPSWYGLLTGRYPFRTNTNVWPEQPVIEEDRMTIASMLKLEGYHTAMVGKWYLGFNIIVQQVKSFNQFKT